MSGLLGKVANQLSGQKPSQPLSGSSGLMHKVTDATTGQKHPQDSQNYPPIYGNNATGRPYPSEGEFSGKSSSLHTYTEVRETKPSIDQLGYLTGQYYRPEGQGPYEPRYEEGHGNYSTPGLNPGGHNDGRGYYPGESNNGYPGGRGGYGNSVPHRREYPSHQAGYNGYGAQGGHEYRGEHRQEYPARGHNAPGIYEGHGEYREGHNGSGYYGRDHGERGSWHTSSGHGGYVGGYGQYGGDHRGGY